MEDTAGDIIRLLYNSPAVRYEESRSDMQQRIYLAVEYLIRKSMENIFIEETTNVK